MTARPTTFVVTSAEHAGPEGNPAFDIICAEDDRSKLEHARSIACPEVL